MENENIVALCMRLFPDLDDIHGREWLEKDVRACLCLTAVHVLASDVPESEDRRAFVNLLKNQHLPFVEHVREARREAKLAAVRDGIRSKRALQRKRGEAAATLTDEELAQEAMDQVSA